MKDLKSRLTSRKLWMALGGIACAGGLAFFGGIEQDQAIEIIKQLVLAYIAAEGGADIVAKFKTK